MRKYFCISFTFGAVLRTLRQKSGYSQEELAERAHIDKSYVSLLEQGKRQPSIIVLFKIADALEVSPTKFIAMLEKDLPKENHEPNFSK